MYIAFSIGGKSEIGGRGGVKNDLKKSDIIYGRPLILFRSLTITIIHMKKTGKNCIIDSKNDPSKSPFFTPDLLSTFRSAN